MNSSLNDEEKIFLRPISNPVPNHESDEMAVQSNGEASRQQLRYPISATNKNPQHPSDSPIVRAQLAFQQSAGSSTAGATNSQHKKWIKTQESGHASCNGNWRQQNVSSRASDVSSTRSVHEAKPVMMQDGSGAKRQQMTTGSTTNAGCRPKSGNWRNHNFNSRAFDASSTKRPAQEAEPVMQYAGGAKPRLQHFIKQEQYPQKDRKRENEKERNSKWHQGNNKQPFKHFPLNFTEVLKMITDNDPGLVVQKFAEESTGLGQFLKSNPANWEIVSIDPSSDWELLLQQRALFKNLESVILNIPKSRSSNLGSKEERLTRLIRSISYLTTEMMTVMPALTCDYLGERFFEDVCALQTMPSFRDFNVNDAFDSLEKEGADRLKNAWEQHSKAIKSNCDGNQRELIRIQRQELMIHLKPPDDFRE
ncbi:uncharacterized protein LOC124313736 [Daphnia pulicaria]|uniref:uncharacterized protein LOC124313736 n=1 Tax=Daphnia pulicaria TaxID=35523 RepID=UPI001EEC6F99|nr:uncharacterized protein LOC124313736 [Daphnia pulicaria]